MIKFVLYSCDHFKRLNCILMAICTLPLYIPTVYSKVGYVDTIDLNLLV